MWENVCHNSSTTLLENYRDCFLKSEWGGWKRAAGCKKKPENTWGTGEHIRKETARQQHLEMDLTIWRLNSILFIHVSYVPATPSSVSVSQRSVCVVPASLSTNFPDTKSPSRASTPHTETSAGKQQAHTLEVTHLHLFGKTALIASILVPACSCSITQMSTSRYDNRCDAVITGWRLQQQQQDLKPHQQKAVVSQQGHVSLELLGLLLQLTIVGRDLLLGLKEVLHSQGFYSQLFSTQQKYICFYELQSYDAMSGDLSISTNH